MDFRNSRSKLMTGVWTAMVTPFKENGDLDLDAYRGLLKKQVAAGISGVIPCGTTGESPTLTMDERKILVTETIATLKGTSVKVAAGTGGNTTVKTLELSQWAFKAGVDALLIVTPYYNKPSQAGLVAHFEAVANSVDCEIVLYNVPGRTGVSFTAETLSKLAVHPRITAVKEATGNVAFTSEIIDRLQEDGRTMNILSGDDATYLPLLSAGACGVISVASNLFPAEMVSIQRAFDRGNFAEALRLQTRFYPLFRDLFIESNPVPVKRALADLGYCRADVRLPLASMLPENLTKLRHSMKRSGVLA